MSRTRELIVNVRSPDLRGLIQNFNSEQRAPTQYFVWADGEEIAVRPVEPTGDQVAPWRDVYESGMTARVAVGFGHRAPTAGDFPLTVVNGGTPTTVSGFPYNVTAANMETAINSTGGRFVTVTKSGVDYIVVVALTGPTFSLQDTTLHNLRPESTVTIKQLVEGTADKQAVWRIRVAQNGMAYASLSTPYPSLGSSVNATSIQVGTDTIPAIQRITLDPAPVGGSGVLGWGQVEETKVICLPDIAGSLHGLIAVTLYQQSGAPVIVRLSNGGGSPGSAPAGGTQVLATYTTGATGAAIATAIETALIAAGYDATATSDVVVITETSNGERTASITGTAGFTVSRIKQGYSFAESVQWNSSEDFLSEALGGLVTASVISPGVINFTFLENGARDAITLITSNFITPKGVTGTLSYDSLAAQGEFAASPDSDFLEPSLSVEIQYTGEQPKTPLIAPSRLYKDIVTTV